MKYSRIVFSVASTLGILTCSLWANAAKVRCDVFAPSEYNTLKVYEEEQKVVLENDTQSIVYFSKNKLCGKDRQIQLEIEPFRAEDETQLTVQFLGLAGGKRVANIQLAYDYLHKVGQLYCIQLSPLRLGKRIEVFNCVSSEGPEN